MVWGNAPSPGKTKSDFWRPHEKQQRAGKERSDIEGAKTAKYMGEIDEVRMEYNVEVEVMGGPRDERDEETVTAEWLKETVLAGESRI